MLLRRTLLVVLSLVCALPALAGGLNQGLEPADLATLLPATVFDPQIPSQEDVTGVAPTARPLRPDEVLAYFNALADASPRARLIEYARSHEDRPLVLLAVSDEATIADLDVFQARHGALLDPRSEPVPTGGEKAVAWMAYGIHGDELSSTDAAAVLAHWLVAGEDGRARELREKLLVLIDPCENPDGRARYLAQITSFAHRTATPDQDDLAHRAVWPWGRGNHYLFDLNRDWFSMVHPESRRSAEIASWIPQLLVDSHEMGANATYLFPPPRHPFNPHLPASARKWERPFSDDQAAALDERGFPYFTGEWNEEFFPGYGSSWASYHGSIGILYEMSRTTGTLVKKRSGTVRTFAQAVEHQLTSSVANLTSLATNVDAVLADQFAARAAAVERGTKGKVRAWVFPPDPRWPRRTEELAAQLTAQGIEVQRLDGDPVKAGGLVDARTGDESALELPVGTLLVRLDQPSGPLARVILDPHVPMNDVFFRDEREYLEKRKGSRLYETTAWSVALGRGVPAYWSGRLPGGDWAAWAPSELPEPPVAGPWTSAVIDGDPDRSPRLLAELLQADVQVRVANKPFTVGGRAFSRGALVIRREGNIADVAAVVADVAARHRLAVHAVNTARAEAGPDLGGAEYPVLVAPRVGVLTGMPVSPTAYGAVWHLLDQELDLRFSALDIGRFGRTDLSRYNVLVFPPLYGGPGMYKQLLGHGGRDRLQRWIEAGGTAIGLAGGAEMLAADDWELTATRFRGDALETYPSPVWSIGAAEAQAAGRPAAVGLRVEPAGKDDDKKKAEQPARTSPYDVAPVLGPGARPFAADIAQGTPLGGEPVAMKDWLAGTLPPGRKQPEEDDLAAADRRLQRFMPQGAMLRADLDPELWLNYGLDDAMTVWFGGDDTLIAAPPVRVAARFADIDRLHLGGLLWPEGAARVTGTAFVTREGVGRGQVILFAGHPVYRRWMKETERMFVNAILLGPGLGTRWSTPW